MFDSTDVLFLIALTAVTVLIVIRAVSAWRHWRRMVELDHAAEVRRKAEQARRERLKRRAEWCRADSERAVAGGGNSGRVESLVCPPLRPGDVVTVTIRGHGGGPGGSDSCPSCGPSSNIGSSE